MSKWNVAMARDAQIINDVTEIRRLCSGNSRGWPDVVRAVKAQTVTCCLCGKQIDMLLRWPHAGSFSVEHRRWTPENLAGLGLTRGECRRRLQDLQWLSGAHLGCNSSDNRHSGRINAYEPKSEESESYVMYVNRRTGESFVASPNAIILDEDLVPA